jgi:hypothetical protein
MKRITTIFIILLLSWISGLSFAQNRPITKADQSPVEFFKEDITLSVYDSIANVRGIYYFRNNTDNEKPFPILFPFFADSLSLFPHNISAYLIDSAKTIALDYKEVRKASGIMIAIPLKPHSATIWHLDYAQKIRSSHATYIITSTSSWHKPLEDATYRFIAPVNFDSVKVWPTADTSYDSSGHRIYLCKKKDFMPQKDMEIFWQRK